MRILTVMLALVPATIANPQSNRDDLTPLEISYVTTVSEDLKSVQVDILVENVKRPTMHLALPNWAPGAYGIRDYGDNVKDLTVVGADRAELPVLRMHTGTWTVDTQGHSTLEVSYSVPVSRRGRFGRRPPTDGEAEPAVTGFQIAGPATYMYVGDEKDLGVTSRYVVPEGWRVANGLLATDDPDVRYARDYDTFIDAPTIVGLYEERTFEVNGTPFSCVFFENAQEYDFDIDAFVDIVKRISTSAGNLYGSFPFPNYVYLFTLPGGGGLEHLNSTSIGLRADAQKDDPEAGASVVAHEFFHTWNVKRIRPIVLGPFDYQRENYTGNLWVSEGWTSYFGDLTLVRTGILSQQEFIDNLGRIIRREQNKPRRKEHSVYWASRNAWHRFPDEEGERVDYYGKGEMLGALIDLKIRHETGNKKSLNDVMRFMNRWFAERDTGFQEGDVERACTAISNYDFSEFFARHVYGTVDPPIADCLAYAGIDYTEDVIPCSFPFALRGSTVSGRPSPEDAETAEPRPGETITMIDGVAFEDANAFLRGHAAGDVVKLTLAPSRRGRESEGDEAETREVEVTLSDEPIVTPTLAFSEDATAFEREVREAWLTSVN